MPDGDTTLRFAAWPDLPLAINQSSDQTISFKGEVPVCIRVCEPICARSKYTIELTILDKPVASITVTGETRLFSCREKD